jgi:SAM-dependent methyltransferase
MTTATFHNQPKSKIKSGSFQCRSCGSSHGMEALDLGRQPLANNLLPAGGLEGETEPRCPLRLAVCLDCHLMQLLDLVPPTQLFSEYLYFSSFSDSMLQHARLAVSRYANEFALGEKNLVVEVASNDGYLLQYFKERGIPALGIEPAENIAKVAEQKGIETRVEFFTKELAEALVREGKSADLILGNNVFAHAPNTNDFVAAISSLLKPSGRAILEFPWGLEMVRNLEFDTIYHEHVFYFNLVPLIPLFQRHGMEIFRVERLPIHGGSLRIFASRKGDYEVEDSVRELLREERESGVETAEHYSLFTDAVERLREKLLSMLHLIKSEGGTIAAYGASAKGSTLLNFCNIGLETLEFIADRSTYKQGRLSPGMHLPILPAEALVERKPDYALLLTWNFAQEILSQQETYRTEGGRFIIPIPQPRVVS